MEVLRSLKEAVWSTYDLMSFGLTLTVAEIIFKTRCCPFVIRISPLLEGQKYDSQKWKKKKTAEQDRRKFIGKCRDKKKDLNSTCTKKEI